MFAHPVNHYTAKRKKTVIVAAREPLLGCTESRQCKVKAHRIWDKKRRDMEKDMKCVYFTRM